MGTHKIVAETAKEGFLGRRIIAEFGHRRNDGPQESNLESGRHEVIGRLERDPRSFAGAVAENHDVQEITEMDTTG